MPKGYWVTCYRSISDPKKLAAYAELEPTATEPDQSAQEEPAEGTPVPAGPWDDPRLPWSGKPGRLDILCWAGITLSGLY